MKSNPGTAFVIPILMLLSLLSCGGHPVTIMTYNVENLFDDVDNGTEYVEFDPARGKWTPELFRVRVDTIAEVVRKSVPGGPDVLMLQEIENGNALKALAETGLEGMGYSRAVLVPKKGLAANTAVLSRLPVSRVGSYQVGSNRGDPVRDVVEVVIEKDGRTLHLLNNHWKSRTGGARETEKSRIEAAGVVGKRVREILVQDPAADVIVAGDMNEGVDELERTRGRYMTALRPAGTVFSERQEGEGIFLTGRPQEAGICGDRLTLYDPWLEGSSAGGSYYYGSRWETYDHFMLSPGLFDKEGFTFIRGSFIVFKPAFLLLESGAPKRWSGLKGPRGYSDHLPLIISLEITD